jgi:hypothetical protein
VAQAQLAYHEILILQEVHASPLILMVCQIYYPSPAHRYLPDLCRILFQKRAFKGVLAALGSKLIRPIIKILAIVHFPANLNQC